MSHYTVNYEGLAEPEKVKKAIQDIQDYLGDERFYLITEEIVKSITMAEADGETLTADDFRLPLTFAGVQGYPVQAWFDYCKRATR